MRALVLVAALLGLSAPAAAQARWRLAPALTLDAGYDDNLFLDPTLSSARPPRSDAVIDVRPTLLAALVTRGHELALAADYFERITPANGDLRDLLLRLSWSSPLWHHLRAAAGAVYEHYGAAHFSDDTFDLGGGDANVRLLWTSFWLQASYRAVARGYSDASRNGQLDVEQRVAASGHVRVHPLVTLDGGYSYWHEGSNEPTAVLDRHRGELGVTVQPLGWLTAAASYAVWGQTLPHGGDSTVSSLPGGPRHDVAHAGVLSLSARPLGWLELFARYDFIVSTADANNGRYRLDEVVGGLSVAWEWTRETRSPPPPLLPTVVERAVTFRAHARRGAHVAVVGDWNGWQPAPLTAIGDGADFAATYTLPPGRHQWALSIDGATVSPPVAAAWADDGFGSRNGVVTVP